MAIAVNIQYVGAKAQRDDSIAGTGLVWRRGEVLPVPQAAAVKLLAHPDVWARADGAEVEIDDPAVEAKKPQDPLDDINTAVVGTMDKPALARLAAEYSLVLDRRLSVEKQRAQILAQLVS